MAGSNAIGWLTRARRAATPALLALLPACTINLDGLSGGPPLGPDGGTDGGTDGGPDAGSCAPESCGGGPCVVAAGEAAGAPAAIVAAEGRVFWIDRGQDRIRRLDPATDTLDDLVPFTPGPGLLAIGGGHAAWVAEDGLWQCPLDDCAAGASSLIAFTPDEAAAVRGLATDGRHAYWTWDEPSGSAGEIRRCALAEGCGGTPEVLAVSQSHPAGVAVTPGDTGNVFWTQYGTGPDFGRVLRLAKDAAAGSMPIQMDALLDFPDRIALGQAEVLWTWAPPEGSPGGVTRCDLAAPCAREEVTPQAEPDRPLLDPAALVIDGADVYWVNRGAGTLMRCPTSGCPGYPEVLAEGLSSPVGVAPQGACVYAIDEAEGGRVVRVPR